MSLRDRKCIHCGHVVDDGFESPNETGPVQCPACGESEGFQIIPWTGNFKIN